MAKDLSRSCPMCEGLQEYKDFAETRNVRELLVGLTHEIGNNLPGQVRSFRVSLARRMRAINVTF